MGEKVVGFHAIAEALKQAPGGSILYLCRNVERKNDQLESIARANKSVTIRKIAEADMDRMLEGVFHRGAMLELGRSQNRSSAVASTTVKSFLSQLPQDDAALVLILDGITDVQNLGAIMRSADQFSVDLVVIPERRSAQANQTVLRISSGASQYVPTATVTNLAREIELLQKNGFWVYGADMGGASIATVKFPHRTVLILGSEDSGMSHLTSKKCDHIISIPTTGHIDSLNVSVAAGILLYEFRRQKA